MTGFVALLLIAVVVLGIMRLAGLKRSAWTMAAAAMALGGAGYAIQGSPGMPSSPRDAAEAAAPIPLGGARHALMGQFDPSDNWLNMADALESRGNTEDAANLLAKQAADHPGDYKLWVGLGNALADHSHLLSPAARLAFQRAQELAPNHPAPKFFLGLAEARSGNREAAIKLWSGILADAPANASWRPMVEDGRMAIGGDTAPPPPTKDQAGS